MHNSTELIGHITSNPDNFINIGVGFVVNEAKIMKAQFPNINLYGVEPSQERYDIIKDDFPGVCEKLAICAVDGTYNAYTDKSHKHADIVMAYNHNTHQLPRVIPKESLDSYVNRHDMQGSVFVWADIEGYELKVLEGCTNLFDNKRIAGFILELWSEQPHDNVPEWCVDKDVIEFLRVRNFIMTHNTKKYMSKSIHGPNSTLKANRNVYKYDGLFERII